MRYVALILVVGLSLGFLVTPAATEDPKWQVVPGYDGVVREGAWAPIFLNLTNEGDPRVGRIVVNVESGMTDRTLPYVTDVDLPQHAKKRYAVYVPSPLLDSIRLDLSGYRVSITPKRTQTAEAGDLVICVVGGDGGFLSFLNGRTGMGLSAVESPQTSGQRWGGPPSRSVRTAEAAVGHLEWSGLPESWLGWDAADVVVLADTSFSSASPAALEALRTWVECGGTLVVPGGAQAPALASSPFASLLPGRIAGTTTLPDLAAVRAWAGAPLESRSTLAAAMTLRPEAEVLCGSRAQPLVVSQPVGAGRVIMTAFDYTAAPVKYYEALWPKLLSARAEGCHLARSAELGNQFNVSTTDLKTTVATMPQAQLPSIWLIVGFLVAYIVLLVPVNYAVLNRLDRRELAWVTTPAIVLLFSLGAYGLGYGMRGGAVLLNRINVIEAAAGASMGRGTAYVAIFSPSRTGYQLAIDTPSGGPRDLSAATEPHLRGGALYYASPQPRVVDANMNMWTTRTFAVDYPANVGRGVSGYLEYDGAMLRANVRNNTGLRLDRCRIVRTRSQGRSKDLRPGQTATLEFEPGRAMPLPTFQQGQYVGSGPDLPAMALSALFVNGPYRQQSPETLPVLVARVDQPAPVSLARTHPRIRDIGLLVVHLPVRLARQRTLQVPEWLVSSRYLEASGSISCPDAYNAPDALEMDHGGVTIEYSLPVAGVSATARSLQLAGPASRPSANISAYDYAHQSWQTMLQNAAAASPSTGGAMTGYRRGGYYPGGGPTGGASAIVLTFPHPQDFLSPDGKVLVKVSVPSGAAMIGPLSLRATVQTQ